MRRFLIAVFIVGVVFSAGLSIAQAEEMPTIPEKIQSMFSKNVGLYKTFDSPLLLTLTGVPLKSTHFL